MSEWKRDDADDPSRELEEADWLIEKADALLRKHKHVAPDAPALEDDDLPLLTDVVEDFAPDASPTPFRASWPESPPATSSPLPAAETPDHEAAVRLAERLVDIDTVVSREIEHWFNTELPSLIERELQHCTQRIREQALAHMRATLVPRLSESLAERLADDDPLKPR